MYYEKDLQKAKNDIEKYLGSKVIVRFKNGKRKQKIKEGVLISAYKSIFLVNILMDENTYSSTTYTYNDILTRNVVITIV